MLYILCVLTVVLLIFSGAVHIKRTDLSRFELRRRSRAGDQVAKVILAREELLRDLLSLQRIVVAVLLVIMALLAIGASGWLVGPIVAFVIALEFGFIGQLALIQGTAQRWYEAREPQLIQFIQRHPRVFRWLRHVTLEDEASLRIRSREELFHVIETSEGILSAEEKALVQHGLTFADRRVRDHMTPVSSIATVAKDELLGPLVLDDLHKTGHSRFPVTNGSLDQLVGMLHVRDLLAIDAGRGTSTVEAAMEPRVFYIHQDQTLDQALAAFLRSHHHLFVVVNDEQQTVGLLSLEDVTEVMMGRKIEDEFDAHEDPRVVAARGRK